MAGAYPRWADEVVAVFERLVLQLAVVGVAWIGIDCLGVSYGWRATHHSTRILPRFRHNGSERVTSRVRSTPFRRFAAGLIGLLVLGACVAVRTPNSLPTSTGKDSSTSAAMQKAPDTSVAGTPTEEEIRQILPDVPVTTMSPDAARAVHTSRLETQQFFASCLAESGFAATVDEPDLSVTVDVPEDQKNRYAEVSSACRNEMFDRFQSLREPDPHQAYRAYLYIRECMIEAGYPVSNPPSEEAFVDNYGMWHPYDLVMADPFFTEEQFDELEATCPQDLSYLIPALGLDQEQP